MTANGKSRQDLVRQADEVRSRLLRTVEQLDQRRHEAVDLRLQVERHVHQLVLAGAVVLLATAGASYLLAHRIATAAERRRQDRWQLVQRVWRHPERAMRAERGSMLAEIARGWLLSVATAALAGPTKWAMSTLFEPRLRRSAPMAAPAQARAALPAARPANGTPEPR